MKRSHDAHANRRDFSLQQLRCFLVVADELHFGRAAQRLQMTQPPLSRQIAALESTLNVVLFDRTSRHVELTNAGKVLLDYAATIVRTASVGRKATIAAAQGGPAFITVGIIPSLPTSFLAKLVEYFSELIPDTELVFQEMHTRHQVIGLDDGTTDIAIVRLPVEHNGLSITRLLLDHFVAIMPSDSEMSEEGESIELSVLANAGFITYSKELGLGIPSVFTQACQQAGFTPRVVKEVLSTATLVSYVARGLGVALVPGTIGLTTDAGIKTVKIARPKMSSEIAVAWRRDSELSTYKSVLHAARTASASLWSESNYIHLEK